MAYPDVKVQEPYVFFVNESSSLQQLVQRGVVTFGACTSAENRSDMVTKPLPVHRLRQLKQWSCLVLDQNERSATGDKEDGQDAKWQQGAAVRIISDSGQSDGGVLDALGNLVRGYSWYKERIGTQVLGATRIVADTLAGNVSRKSIERGLSGCGSLLESRITQV